MRYAWLCVRASPETDGAALVRATLILAHPAPHAGILAGINGPAQAVVNNGATPANLFCFVNLEQGWTAVPYREEQLRVHLTAGGFVTPVHDVNSFSPSGLRRPASGCRLQLVKNFTSYAIFVRISPSSPGLSRCPRSGDVPVIREMTREAPLAGHRNKPLNLVVQAQEATAQPI
jgi:hypothetical protein